MSIEDEKLSIFMVKFIDKCKDIQKDFTDLSPYNQMRAEKIIDQVSGSKLLISKINDFVTSAEPINSSRYLTALDRKSVV